MVRTWTFDLGLLLCVLLSGFKVTPAADHPPDLEGQNVVLNCGGRSVSTQRRSVYWMTTEPGQETVNRVTCHSTEPSCRNYYQTRFIATASYTDTDYNSSLTILAISQRERFLTVDCRFYEKEINRSYDIRSWNISNISNKTTTISNILSPPENPVCSALYNTEEGTVNISCSASKVFPGIVCKIFEVHDDNELPLTTPDIKYIYTESNTSGYRSAECNVVTSLSKPGVYKYKVVMYPGLTDNDLLKDAARQIYTNDLTVVGKPAVYIKSSTVCQKGNTSHHFRCTSRWLPAPANLVWFKNTTLISNTTTTTSCNAEFCTSQSSVEQHSMTASEGPIHCRANYVAKGTARNKTIDAEAIVVATTVPSTYFTYKGVHLGRQFIVEEGKTTSKLECKVNGSGPAVNEIKVVCKISDQVSNFSSVTETVIFDIPPITTTDTGICYCSVARTSECYEHKVNFTFSVGHAVYDVSIVQSKRLGSYINSIYYITAGFIGLVFLVFLLGTCMFLVRKWDKLYADFYGKFNSAEIQEVVINGHLYYNPAEIHEVVNNGHLYYSVPNIARGGVLTTPPGSQTSLETENIVENDNGSATSRSNSSAHVYSNVDFESDEEFVQRADLPATLHPPLAERNQYANVTNSVVPTPETTQPRAVVDARHEKSGKSNRLSHTSDLLENSLYKHNTIHRTPKPCKRWSRV